MMMIVKKIVQNKGIPLYPKRRIQYILIKNIQEMTILQMTLANIIIKMKILLITVNLYIDYYLQTLNYNYFLLMFQNIEPLFLSVA